MYVEVAPSWFRFQSVVLDIVQLKLKHSKRTSRNSPRSACEFASESLKAGKPRHPQIGKSSAVADQQVADDPESWKKQVVGS